MSFGFSGDRESTETEFIVKPGLASTIDPAPLRLRRLDTPPPLRHAPVRKDLNLVVR